MKKQLEKEIEQQAPYSEELEQRIIQKIKKQHTWKYQTVLAGFLVLLLYGSVLFMKEQSLQTSVGDNSDVYVESAMIPSDEGQVYLNAVRKVTKKGDQTITELQMIEHIYLEDGSYKETRLTSGYKEVAGEEVIDNVQKMVMSNQPSTVVIAEELQGKVVKDSEKLVKKQIASIFGRTDERKDLRYLEFFSINENEPISASEDILNLQHIFGQIVWYEDVKVNITRAFDAKLTLFIRYDVNQPEHLLEYDIWIEDSTITLVDENGFGELTGEQATLLKNYLQSDSAVRDGSLTIMNSEDKEAANELIEKAVQMPGIANMTNPEIRFELEGKRYFLWWNKDNSATLMHANDTHTLYTIPGAGELKAILERAR